MNPSSVSHMPVDGESSVLHLIGVLKALPRDYPHVYVDLEGIRLSRYGSISLMTLFVPPQNCVYLVDVHIL
jgi:exonuclease 3'-5' domain-containing protein 1